MTQPAAKTSARIIPIGGVGEFGANATIVQTAATTILIDYGIMFPPDQRQPGVEYYINDPKLLLKNFPDLSAIFLTHAHEDHIGGVGYLLRHIDLPIYTMPYTANMVRKALQEYKLKAAIHHVRLNEPVVHGDLSVEFIGVTHSIVQACALAIRCPQGTVIHSGDFKVDPLPDDQYPFQSDRLAEIGEEGVALLIMDSTNSLKAGFCPSDHEITPYLEEHIRTAPGRVFFTTFSSHMPRIRKLRQIAKRTGRKIVLVGRGLKNHFENSLSTGYMAHEPELFISSNTADAMEDQKLIYVVTGSQAEQQSALVRISKDGFRGIKIKAGDRVIFSSKSIPGNERQVALLASDFERRGVEIITGKMSMVHTSGHGYREDIAYLLALTRPKTVVPIHGEFIQLLSHYRWLGALSREERQVILVEDGDVLELREGQTTKQGVIECGMIPIDGNRYLPLDNLILRDRKDMMYSGLILISIYRDQDDNHFDVAVNGMVEKSTGEIGDMVRKILAQLDFSNDQPEKEYAKRVYAAVKRAIKKEIRGKPLIRVIINSRILC